MNKKDKTQALIPQEYVENKILLIRSKKVMLDRDLAELYGISTGNLNKAVSRNLDRFSDDFMFRLTKEELKNLVFHFGTSSWGGTRIPPRVFTEHGILMLSSVLNSKKAIQVNIQIMRTFTKIHLKINGVARHLRFERDEVAENEAYRDMLSLSDKSQPNLKCRSSQAYTCKRVLYI